MSDCGFDYAYARAWQFADELAERLNAGVEYGPETVAELRRIVDVARRAGSLMREAEWLFTGWADEDEFKRRIATIDGADRGWTMMLIACFITSGWLLVRSVRDMRGADAAVCLVLLVAVVVMMKIA